MNIIAVDDEYHALKNLERAIIEAVPDSTVSAFVEPEDALSYAADKRVDIAFLDINMSSMDGITLADQLKSIYNKTNIVFVTGYTEYAVDAFSVEASDYVVKPVEPEAVTIAVSRLRDPVEDESKPKLIQEIGDFTFDHAAHRVYRAGKDLLLTHREYSIFHFLAGNPNIYFSPQELYTKTCGQDANNELRALYSHISRLRKKLGLDDITAKSGIDIEQQRGKGYRLIIQTQ